MKAKLLEFETTRLSAKPRWMNENELYMRRRMIELNRPRIQKQPQPATWRGIMFSVCAWIALVVAVGYCGLQMAEFLADQVVSMVGAFGRLL